jgi:hypothetical protein
MFNYYWISTIAKIPSTEQDGGFNVMSMGENGSSLTGMRWLLLQKILHLDNFGPESRCTGKYM